MMANMPPEAMQGMSADMTAAMPPEAMQGMSADMIWQICLLKLCRV